MKKVAKIFGSFIFSPYLCTRNQETTVSPMQWRDGRVVDYSGLENRRTERYRGFESLSLRRIQQRIKLVLCFFVLTNQRFTILKP